MKSKLIAILTVMVLMFTMGCSNLDDDNSDTNREQPSVKYEYGNEQSVKVITIDGVKCFLYDGYNSGGIACDWSNNEQVGP